MGQARQWRGRHSTLPVLCLLAFLIVALEGTFVSAAGQGGDPRRPSAALLVQDGTHDFRGQVIRCQPGEEVGIWAESSRSLTIANVVIEGCEIGLVITRSTANSLQGGLTEGAARWSGQVEGVRMRVTRIGIFAAGSASTLIGNVVGGARYGIVVTGNDNILLNNQSNDNLSDGFLVTGDRNLLEGNEALRNGGVGIHVARMIPMVGKHRFLSFIQDRGLGNTIRGNTALDNTRDLVEFADCPLSNQWIGNIFSTRQPSCIE